MDLEIFGVQLYEIVIFITFGLGQEVVATALKQRGKFLMGYSSLWYVPIYALAPFFLLMILPFMADLSWLARGLIYALIFNCVEYVSMGFLKLILGKTPSEDNYRRSRWSIQGLTRLDHTPLYFISGLMMEWLYLSIH